VTPETVLPKPTAVLAVQSFNSESFETHVMPTYGRFPIALERGEGVWVWDSEGRQYLDCVAGIATCTLGHAHPAMVKAVSEQMNKLHHVSNLYYIPKQGELAHWLTSHSCADKVFFCNSGAEANEAAIKLARKYAHQVLKTDTPIILTATSSFHGRTLATITATGQPKYQKNFDPLVPGFVYVPFNDFDALEAEVLRINATAKTIAALLIEPLQGEGGVNPGDRDYFQKVRALCDRQGILLMLDEVQVGMGRTGKLWGYENLGIEPDVFTLAKGLAGGVPIGAMLCKNSCSLFQPGDHASTFGGNPLACASAIAVCQTIEAEHLIEHVQRMGESLSAGLQKRVSAFPHLLLKARGWGLIQGLVLQEDAVLTAIDIVKAAMDESLLLVPAGPKVVRFVPPLIITELELQMALERLDAVLHKLS
jgi:acetylornithine/N-succinyldiaminopimelate aminotransferase